MDSFEFNKIAAAVLVGALLFVGINILSEGLFEVPEANENAYVVEGLEAEDADTTTDVVEEAGPSLATLLANASMDAGERAFRVCAGCHSINEGGDHRVGPNLYGVMGGAVAGQDGFGYSSAMTDHGGTWTYEAMYDWLTSPANAIPGNRMSFAGVRRESDRAALLLYLAANSNNPPPLPVDEMIEEASDAVEEMAEDVMDGDAN